MISVLGKGLLPITSWRAGLAVSGAMKAAFGLRADFFLGAAFLGAAFFAADFLGAAFFAAAFLGAAFLAAFLGAAFLPAFFAGAPFFGGTFAPFFLASESPIAMACFGFFTFAPVPDF